MQSVTTQKNNLSNNCLIGNNKCKRNKQRINCIKKIWKIMNNILLKVNNLYQRRRQHKIKEIKGMKQ